tara:strand:+ start:22207 stop:23502 length:1296 start_codon:yes stop_codon:yes gene_type:complete
MEQQTFQQYIERITHSYSPQVFGDTAFEGSNSQSARDVFHSRREYNSHAYTRVVEVNPGEDPRVPGDKALVSLIDNGPVLLYGRVDLNLMPIQPRAERMSSIVNPDGSVYYVLDFVANSFKNFYETYNLGIQVGKALRNSEDLSPLIVAKGKPDANILLNQKIRDTADEFINLNYSKRSMDNILDFDSFIHIFTDFLIERSQETPVNYSSFITSNVADLNFSGLMIDLSSVKYGNDKETIERIIDNRNFEYYRDLAESFGFLVSKKYPSKLIANLNSPQMRNNICVCAQGYNNSLDANNLQQIIETYFEKPHLEDINYLFNLYQQTYSKLANDFPRQQRTSVINGCVTKKQNYRVIPSLSVAKNLLDDDALLDFYLRIKNAEHKVNYLTSTLNNISIAAKEIAKIKTLYDAVEYIGVKFTPGNKTDKASLF